MNRRHLLQLSIVPVIGAIDYSDWTENTTDGLPHGVTWDDFGFQDLVEWPSLGPYLRWAWMDWVPGETLPKVRAMCWVSGRDMYDNRCRVGIDFGEGYQNYDVTDLIDPETMTPFFVIPNQVEKEALMRVIRVIIREHYGYPTTYTT